MHTKQNQEDITGKRKTQKMRMKREKKKRNYKETEEH